MQARENTLALRNGHEPRFSIIGPREIIAIDALWSLYGLTPPYRALEILREIEAGDLRRPPLVAAVPKTPVPRLGKLFVGTDWQEEVSTGDPARDAMISGGIRNPVLEMFSESCGLGIQRMSDGHVVTAYPTAEAFDVDEEAAADFIGCGMAYELLDEARRAPQRMWTDGVRRYLAMGLVAPAHGSVGRWHRIAKRTDWLQRHDLHGQVQLDVLAARLAQQQSRQQLSGEQDQAWAGLVHEEPEQDSRRREAMR